MKSRNIKILKDKVKRKNNIKNDIKYKLLKSIIQNKKVEPLVRINASIKLNKKRRINNMCLITGRFGGVFKFCNLSRHMIKKFGNLNKLQNVKIVSW